MKIFTFTALVFRWGTMLLAVAAIVWTYSVNSQEVTLSYDKEGNSLIVLTKSQLFYLASFIFLLTNVILASVKRQIHKLPVAIMPIPHKKLWDESREELDEFLGNWLFAIISAINFILGAGLLTLATANSLQYAQNINDFAWVYYLSFVILLAVLVLIPIRLLRPPVPAS